MDLFLACNNVISYIQEGWTALHNASVNGRATIADLLIQAGANVDIQTKVRFKLYFLSLHVSFIAIIIIIVLKDLLFFISIVGIYSPHYGVWKRLLGYCPEVDRSKGRYKPTWSGIIINFLSYNSYEAKFILSNSVPAAHADSCTCIISLHFSNTAPYFVVGLLPFAS